MFSSPQPHVRARVLAIASATVLGFGAASVGLTAEPVAAAAAMPQRCMTVGIGTNFQWHDTAGHASTDLRLLRSKGVTRIREDIFWHVVQPNSPRQWNWASYDQLFATASRAHVAVLPIIGYGTKWASAPKSANEIPHSVSGQKAYARFAAAVVKRYGSHGLFWRTSGAGLRYKSVVSTVELWNEPWLAPSTPSVRDFVRLVSRAADAVHHVNRHVATMINVDHRWSRAARNVKSHLWGDAVLKYSKTLRKKINRWAIHPYAWPSGGPHAVSDSLNQVRWLMRALDKNKMRGSVWITEVGFSSADQPRRLTAAPSLWSNFLVGVHGLTGRFAPKETFVFTSSRPTEWTRRGSWDYGYNLLTATGGATRSLDSIASSRCFSVNQWRAAKARAKHS